MIFDWCPLCSVCHVRCRNSRRDTRRPALKCVACTRHRRRNNFHAVVLLHARPANSTISIKRYRVLVYFPLRRVYHAIKRHCRSDFGIPALKRVALSVNYWRNQRITIVKLPIKAALTTIRIKNDSVLVRCPLRNKCMIIELRNDCVLIDNRISAFPTLERITRLGRSRQCSISLTPINTDRIGLSYPPNHIEMNCLNWGITIYSRSAGDRISCY